MERKPFPLEGGRDMLSALIIDGGEPQETDVNMQQTHIATPVSESPHRDPQNFTRGDVLAWKVVAYTAGGITVAASVAGIAALVAIVSA